MMPIFQWIPSKPFFMSERSKKKKTKYFIEFILLCVHFINVYYETTIVLLGFVQYFSYAHIQGGSANSVYLF